MNGQDPLAQLRDIHMPEPSGWWPPAPGWWLLAALVLIGLTAATVWLWRRYQRNRYRQLARQQLADCWARYQTHGDTRAYLQELNQLLRRAALHAYPQSAPRHAYGTAWLSFLDHTIDNQCRGKPNPFARGPGRLLISGPYRQNVAADAEPLHQLASYWLLHHRPLRANQPWQEASHAAV